MTTPWHLAASAEMAQAKEVARSSFRAGAYGFSLRQTASSLWLRVGRKGSTLLAIRLGYAPDETLRISRGPENTHIISTSYGRVRVHIERSNVVRARVWVTSLQSLSLTNWPRDLIFLSEGGTLHTRQRGLRSGIVYASAPSLGSLLYFQNYTSLTSYFEATHTSPADCIGGAWPEVGFALPANADSPLPADREFCISDVFLSLDTTEPHTDGAIAIAYLDHVAAIYSALDRRQPDYHDWARLAKESVRDLTFSPDCTLRMNRRTYLAPYAGDRTKPPESMVQFTVMLPLDEYAEWSSTEIPLLSRLIEALPSFFDSKIECLVRWPDGQVAPGPPDIGANTRYMDSWYLYHSLFNLARVVKRTNHTRLRGLLRRSLDYARRTARRFEYRFPVFFDLDTLEILRAEARPGAGGENDVAGLYGLVMIEAHEIFGDPSFLEEAQEAAERLQGGFKIAYQMNATGFAAEAMLRLYLLTGRQQYLERSYLCLANVLDNTWLWESHYGNTREYPTFFGIFPLPDAPYLAAYEELENTAKFREYLRRANDKVRPSVRFLLAEYCRYVLDRGWYYFPKNLPRDAVAETVQSGRLSREIAVPVEDLRDGWEKSGQVGQEVYGSGLAPALAVRHYHYIESWSCWLFCDYPAFDLRTTQSSRPITLRFNVAGDERGTCSVRIIPEEVGRRAPRCTVRAGRRLVSGSRTPEGHEIFAIPGNCAVTLQLA